MAQQDLDEIQWRAPQVVQYMGGIHENTVLHYFAESPFFDRTSNNATLTTQASINPSMAHIIQTRDAFEDSLRKMRGLEYMVAFGPKDFGGEAPIGEGSWVIRKQERQKNPQGLEDEIKVLATYYVVGENVYMAPSAANILSTRLLSTSLALKKLTDIASTLPSFSPSLGYRYFKPAARSSESVGPSQDTQISDRSTPMPDISSQTDSVKTASVSSTVPTSVGDTQALYESFGQFLRYGYEYMDENPLVGEPGQFKFSQSKQHLQAQQQAAQRERQANKLQLDTSKQQDSAPASQLSSAPKSPLKEPTSTKRAGTGPRLKRRKSKAPTSPSSPINLDSPV